MIERRLQVARELLNPSNSVLIVAIDDKEYARLALLLEQIFPDAKQEMITTVINPRGKYRLGEFARCEEYLFFLAFGDAKVLGEPDEDFGTGSAVAWRTLRRSDLSSARGTKKGGTGQFFPIYVNERGRIEKIGNALPHNVDRKTAEYIEGCTAVFPVRDDGTEMNWGLTVPSLSALLKKGYVRVAEVKGFSEVRSQPREHLPKSRSDHGGGRHLQNVGPYGSCRSERDRRGHGGRLATFCESPCAQLSRSSVVAIRAPKS